MGWLLLLTTTPAAYGRTSLALNLEIATGQRPTSTARTPVSGAMLVLNAMPEVRRQQLADSLAKLAAVVDKKKNPLFVSLDDSEERSAVEDLIKQTAPAFTAASTLSAGTWQSPEGDVRVRPVRHCVARRRCVPLLGTPGRDDLERRARFLAWPLGYAILLSVDPRADVDKIAEALRAPGSSQIALALTSAELHALRTSPALSPLFKHAGHLVRSMPAKRPPLLDALASLAGAATAKDGLPWLKLPAEVILVVPRLGSLATSAAFVDDVRRRVQGVSAKIEWLASPEQPKTPA